MSTIIEKLNMINEQLGTMRSALNMEGSSLAEVVTQVQNNQNGLEEQAHEINTLQSQNRELTNQVSELESQVPALLTIGDVSELEEQTNAPMYSTANIVRYSYSKLSFDEGTVVQGNIKMPDYVDLRREDGSMVDWSNTQSIVAEFSENYLSRHLSVQIEETWATVTYANYDTGKTEQTRYEGDGLCYNRVSGPDIIEIDKLMQVFNQSISPDYQLCSWFVSVENPIPIRSFLNKRSGWSLAPYKIITLNEYYREYGPIISPGMTLAFRKPAKGMSEEQSTYLMLDFMLTQYRDASLRWSCGGTSCWFEGVSGNMTWFSPELMDMGGSLMMDMSLREKMLLEFYPNLTDSSPVEELSMEEAMMIGDDKRNRITLLRKFIPTGQEDTGILEVVNEDTLWPEEYSFVTVLEEMEIMACWSNDGVIEPTYKDVADLFCIVVEE